MVWSNAPSVSTAIGSAPQRATPRSAELVAVRRDGCRTRLSRDGCGERGTFFVVAVSLREPSVRAKEEHRYKDAGDDAWGAQCNALSFALSADFFTNLPAADLLIFDGNYEHYAHPRLARVSFLPWTHLICFYLPLQCSNKQIV